MEGPIKPRPLWRRDWQRDRPRLPCEGRHGRSRLPLPSPSGVARLPRGAAFCTLWCDAAWPTRSAAARLVPLRAIRRAKGQRPGRFVGQITARECRFAAGVHAAPSPACDPGRTVPVSLRHPPQVDKGGGVSRPFRAPPRSAMTRPAGRFLRPPAYLGAADHCLHPGRTGARRAPKEGSSTTSAAENRRRRSLKAAQGPRKPGVNSSSGIRPVERPPTCPPRRCATAVRIRTSLHPSVVRAPPCSTARRWCGCRWLRSRGDGKGGTLVSSRGT